MSGVTNRDDDEFFDEPLNGRSAAEKKMAAERHSSASSASSHPRSGCSSSIDESDSDSDHSSAEKRKESSELASSGGKYTVVIPSPSDSPQVQDQGNCSKASKSRSTKHKEPVQKRAQQREEKSKKPIDESKSKTVSPEYRKERSSTSSYSESDSSSDEDEYKNSEVRHSRRSASSTSFHGGQQVAKHTTLRAASAPAKRPQQFRPASGYASGSRMDVKPFLDSLLRAENARTIRRGFLANVADPVEFRRRRNFTFSDARLEAIERENKRLLDKIVTIHYSQATHSRDSQKRLSPVKPASFPDAARIKELEKIEKQNLV